VRRRAAGLVAGLERKNGWTLAEHAGEVSPDGMQRLLRGAEWDVGGVRDDIRDYVLEQLGDRDGVLGASIDMIEQFGATLPPTEVEAMSPPVGAEIGAVVQQVRRWGPPAWARLSIRPRDLELFRWPCDFCREPVTLSPGGGGLVLDVRSNDGPGSHTVISHRACLADRLHPCRRHVNTGSGSGSGSNNVMVTKDLEASAQSQGMATAGGRHYCRACAGQPRRTAKL
jgi:hypothetical protein